jgi:hypothetical protein
MDQGEITKYKDWIQELTGRNEELERIIREAIGILDNDCGSQYHDHCGCGAAAGRILEEAFNEDV